MQQDPLIGKRISAQYELLELVGSGGMGRIYKAQDLALNRIVALKLLSFTHLNSESFLRFQEEGKNIANLKSACIANVYQIGICESGEPFMVLEFVDGEPLSNVIANDSPLNIDWCVFISSNAFNALEHAHERGVLHRDIKPSNMLIEKSTEGFDWLKIIDFGVSKNATRDPAQSVTVAGQVFGSPLYMSPEQCRGDAQDRRSDIYSLGCTIYEMLTGSPPFLGNSGLETIQMHLSDTPKKPSDFDLTLKAFDDFLLAALEKQPANRPASMKALANLMQQAHVIYQAENPQLASRSMEDRFRIRKRPAAEKPGLRGAISAAAWKLWTKLGLVPKYEYHMMQLDSETEEKKP